MIYPRRKMFTFSLAVTWVVLTIFCSPAFGQTKGGNRIAIDPLFTPSGWMGDGEYGRKYVTFSGVSTENPHSLPTSIKISYEFGPAKWGGIYWQNQPDNWGDKPGNNYSGKGLTKVTFWARGEKGNEVVEFKAGGIDNTRKKYRDSFAATTGRQTLSKEWKKYEIDLSNTDLNSVIGGFCWVASADYNIGKRIVFFLDDVFFE